MGIKALAGDHLHDRVASATNGLVLVIHDCPEIRKIQLEYTLFQLLPGHF